MNTLIYSMGQKADGILQSFQLLADDEKKYDMVKMKFDGYFIQRCNHVPSLTSGKKVKMNLGQLHNRPV